MTSSKKTSKTSSKETSKTSSKKTQKNKSSSFGSYLDEVSFSVQGIHSIKTPKCPTYYFRNYATILNSHLSTIEEMINKISDKTIEKYATQIAHIMFKLNCIFKKITEINCPTKMNKENHKCQSLFKDIDDQTARYMKELDIPIEVNENHTDDEITVIQIFICLMLIYKIATFLVWLENGSTKNPKNPKNNKKMSESEKGNSILH